MSTRMDKICYEYTIVYNLTKKYCLDEVANQNEIWSAITKIDWSLQV